MRNITPYDDDSSSIQPTQTQAEILAKNPDIAETLLEYHKDVNQTTRIQDNNNTTRTVAQYKTIRHRNLLISITLISLIGASAFVLNVLSKEAGNNPVDKPEVIPEKKTIFSNGKTYNYSDLTEAECVYKGKRRTYYSDTCKLYTITDSSLDSLILWTKDGQNYEVQLKCKGEKCYWNGIHSEIKTIESGMKIVNCESKWEETFKFQAI